MTVPYAAVSLNFGLYIHSEAFNSHPARVLFPYAKMQMYRYLLNKICKKVDKESRRACAF